MSKTKLLLDLVDCLRNLTGTLEEIAEVMSQIRLGHNDKPCMILNIDGYYETLRELLDHMVREGFLDKESRDKFLFPDDVESISELLG